MVVALVVLGLGGVAAPSAAAAGGTARASILSLTASPRTVPAAGGSVVVTVRVRNATLCTFTGQSGPLTSLQRLATTSCRSGVAGVVVSVGPNRTAHVATVQYYVRAVDSRGRSVRKGVVVNEAAAPSPGSTAGPEASSSVAVATTALPSASAGVAYSASLSASGGRAPYTWSIVGGALPAGVTLSASGVLTGVPTVASQASFTVQVADSAVPAATATATVSLDVSPPPTPTVETTNWSGYIAYGGPFTAAKGTFDVPALTAGSTSTATSEWVGIDGASADDPSLIQAGVGESYDPSTNLVSYHAWWEILPDVETRVPLQVSPGDELTVTIAQVSTGLWGISLSNVTTGQSFQTVQAYSGPGTSAEWVVEAPTSALTDTTYTLGQYSPNVTFTNLGITGIPTSFEQDVIVQDGTTVSTPSALTAAGFSVAYGATSP